VHSSFIHTIERTFGLEGKDWLSRLPGLIIQACRRWDLTGIQPVSDLSYSYICFGKRGHADIVLKIGFPNDELFAELACLKCYNGWRAVCLLDADVEKGMLLLERIQPGHPLAEIEDDEKATEIAAKLMSQLWCPVPADRESFILLDKWFNGFERLREHYNGNTGPLPEELVERAEQMSKELLRENQDEMLLHGDFHHYNILESRRGWLTIDPKGVIGPKGYEVGPFLINPVRSFLRGSNPKEKTQKRISILSERLEMEPKRLARWGFCHAVLSAFWSLEEDGDWGYGIQCAEILHQLIEY
jgi:streptomycin 6-kinase